MGSTTIAALIIIAVHLLVCMTLCLLHHVGVLKVDGLLLPFMALIPLWAVSYTHLTLPTNSRV